MNAAAAVRSVAVAWVRVMIASCVVYAAAAAVSTLQVRDHCGDGREVDGRSCSGAEQLPSSERDSSQQLTSLSHPRALTLTLT